MTNPIWSPRFTITPAISRSLTQFEMAHALVETVIMPLDAYAEMRSRASVQSSRASNFI